MADLVEIGDQICVQTSPGQRYHGVVLSVEQAGPDAVTAKMHWGGAPAEWPPITLLRGKLMPYAELLVRTAKDTWAYSTTLVEFDPPAPGRHQLSRQLQNARDAGIRGQIDAVLTERPDLVEAYAAALEEEIRSLDEGLAARRRMAEQLESLCSSAGIDLLLLTGSTSRTCTHVDPGSHERCEKYGVFLEAQDVMCLLDRQVSLGSMFTDGGKLLRGGPLQKHLKCKTHATTSAKLAVYGGKGSMNCDLCRAYMTKGRSQGLLMQYTLCGTCLQYTTALESRKDDYMLAVLKMLELVTPFKKMRVLTKEFDSVQADYMFVAEDGPVPRRKMGVCIEWDGPHHHTQAYRESDRGKNAAVFRHLMEVEGCEGVLLLRLDMRPQYWVRPDGAQKTQMPDRLMIQADFLVTFLRGGLTDEACTLLYLFYDMVTSRGANYGHKYWIDMWAAGRGCPEFQTLLSCQAPRVRAGAHLPDWGCCMDMLLPVRGGKNARKYLALDARASEQEMRALKAPADLPLDW
jgi:hypothetical protein